MSQCEQVWIYIYVCIHTYACFCIRVCIYQRCPYLMYHSRASMHAYSQDTHTHTHILPYIHNQIKRLADISEFVKSGLTDPEADPERSEEGLKALRFKIKQRLYKSSLCEAKGVGVVEDLGKAAKAETQKKGKVSTCIHLLIRKGNVTHMCMSIYVCTHMWTCANYMCTCMHKYTPTHMHVCISLPLPLSLSLCICMCAYCV
jgi:hypothetical protein